MLTYIAAIALLVCVAATETAFRRVLASAEAAAVSKPGPSGFAKALIASLFAALLSGTVAYLISQAVLAVFGDQGVFFHSLANVLAFIVAGARFVSVLQQRYPAAQGTPA